MDAEGRAVADPTLEGERGVELIEQDGEAVAAVTYEASLAEQPELVDAVVAAAGLAIRNERLQAELRAEVRLAGTLADTAPSLLTNVGTDGRILKLNEATLRASGYEDDAEVRGKLFWEVFIDEDDRDAMVERFQAAAPDFPATEYENTFTNLRGERLVIYWRSTPVVDEHGKVVSIVAAGLDITERHRLEAEKERERVFLNAIANNAPSLICLIDDEGRVTDQGANTAFERTLERDPSDIGGEIFWMRYVHPSDADEVRERIQRVVAGDQLGEHDNYWVTGTGRRLLMAWTCTPLPPLDERRLYLVTGVDITERSRRESEVHEARDFLQTVVSTMPSLLVIVDSEALIVENGVNRAFTDTFGWSAWESTGRSFLELVHPEDEYAVRMAIAAAANGGATHRPGGPLAPPGRRRGDRRVDRDAEPRPGGPHARAPVRHGRHRAKAARGGDPGERGALPRGHRARARRDPRGRLRPAGEALEPGRRAHLRLDERRDPGRTGADHPGRTRRASSTTCSTGSARARRSRAWRPSASGATARA